MTLKKAQAKSKSTLRAAAIEYERRSGIAPKVAALGEGASAEEIFKLARRYGIPIRQDSHLAKRLSKNKVASAISEEDFDPVARLFVDLGILD